MHHTVSAALVHMKNKGTREATSTTAKLGHRHECTSIMAPTLTPCKKSVMDDDCSASIHDECAFDWQRRTIQLGTLSYGLCCSDNSQIPISIEHIALSMRSASRARRAAVQAAMYDANTRMYLQSEALRQDSACLTSLATIKLRLSIKMFATRPNPYSSSFHNRWMEMSRDHPVPFL